MVKYLSFLNSSFALRYFLMQMARPLVKLTLSSKWVPMLIVQYHSLRSVSSLKNPQNSGMKFCENIKWTCWKSPLLSSVTFSIISSLISQYYSRWSIYIYIYSKNLNEFIFWKKIHSSMWKLTLGYGNQICLRLCHWWKDESDITCYWVSFPLDSSVISNFMCKALIFSEVKSQIIVCPST
jgi:hypothetical protein